MNDELEPNTISLDGLDPALLEFIARDIEIAFDTNPNSWALYRVANGDIVLSVEAIAVTTISAHGGDLNVVGNAEDLAFQSIDRTSIGVGYRYFPGFKIKARSVEHLIGLAAEFADQHHDAIINLAKRVSLRTNRATEHQPQTLDALSAAVGRELPQPAYFGALFPTSKEQPTAPTNELAVLAGYDRSLLELVARDIELAHEVHPNSWVLYRWGNGDIILIVEFIAPIVFNKRTGGLLVLGSISNEIFGELDPQRIKSLRQ